MHAWMVVAPRTLAQLAAEVIEDLRPSYDLVYVDYRDKLSNEQAAMIVRGDVDAFWESTTDWESDSARQAAVYVADEDAKDVVERWQREDDTDYSDLLDRWQYSDERDTVILAIQERDSGSWVRELINQSDRVLLRVPTEITEDESLSFTEVSPEHLLERLGLEATPDNIEAAKSVIGNSSPEFSVIIGYLVFAVDLSDIYNLPPDCEWVEVTDPHVWLGNPFAGSGWAEKFTGTFRVKRSDLKTDKDAFGYGWSEVTGGVVMSAYESDIRPVTEESE